MKQTMNALAWLGCWLALGSAAVAQQPPQPGVLADQYAQSSRRNAAMLQHYSWTMRVAVTMNGKAQTPQLYMMTHDVSGKLQKTPLTVQKQKTYRGLRGRIEKKKVGEAKQYIEAVAQVVKQYATPTPGTMMNFFSKAQPVPQPDGTVLIAGANFLQTGDSVSFIMDPATRQPKVYNFATQVNGDTVNGSINFAMIPNGPRYPAQVTISVPSKSLQAQVENFNYTLQQQTLQP